MQIIHHGLASQIAGQNLTYQGVFQWHIAIWGGGNYSDLALVEMHYAFQWTTAMKPACLPFSVDYWDTKSLVTP